MILMNSDHTRKMQELEESLNEANRIKHQREKQLYQIKLEIVKMRLLLRKMNNVYGLSTSNS